jgi:putative ABC transport system permease protein
MEQIVASSVAARRTTMLLVTVFALVALLLATVGVYAIASQAVAQRTNEIGLRMAMGARSLDVIWLVFRQELPVIAAGSAVGLAGAIAGTRVLRASLYEVSPGDPLTLAAAISLLAIVAVFATLIPAHRAAGVDPLSALRSRL